MSFLKVKNKLKHFYFNVQIIQLHQMWSHTCKEGGKSFTKSKLKYLKLNSLHFTVSPRFLCLLSQGQFINFYKSQKWLAHVVWEKRERINVKYWGCIQKPFLIMCKNTGRCILHYNVERFHIVGTWVQHNLCLPHRN